ncbi:MAG: hypothetical protein DI562_10165 [Stenotrophomonas acidaminiphila]|nr:MAG: hypothetical protein DI562_10165 [Stenotrophomonas acidaminiphila]
MVAAQALLHVLGWVMISFKNTSMSQDGAGRLSRDDVSTNGLVEFNMHFGVRFKKSATVCPVPSITTGRALLIAAQIRPQPAME